MATYYFLKVVTEGKNLRVKPLPSQKFTDGSSVEDLYVRISKTLRKEDRIFYVKELHKKAPKAGGKEYYTASGIEVIDETTKPEILEVYKTITGKDAFIEKKVLLDEILGDTKYKSPTSSGDGFYMSTDNWSLLVRNIKRNINTLILGPTGCGKTSCVREVCTRLGIPLHVFDMGSMIDPISSLLGVHRIKDGKSIFDFAGFTKAIQEPGVILLDEINRSSMGSNNILFPCLDDRRSLSIEIASGDTVREIKVHPEVTFIATANIGAEYTGTMSMDRALINRFFPIELGTIPSNEEEAVLFKRTGISPEKAEKLVKITNNIRSMASKSELSTSVSIRETLMVASLISDGWSLKSAMELIYLPLFEGDKVIGERSTVLKLISSY